MAMAPAVSSFANPFPAPHRKRIVLVDDEPLILKTWKQILETFHYEVVCCGNAADALAAIAAGCDCVITDHHMPGMTGIEMMQIARRTSNARFLLMTANDSPELRQEATQAGASCVLNKPTPIPVVLDALENICCSDAA